MQGLKDWGFSPISLTMKYNHQIYEKEDSQHH